MLEDELADAYLALAAHPFLGVVVRLGRLPLRRVVLATGHLLLYRVRPRLREIQIVQLRSLRVNA